MIFSLPGVDKRHHASGGWAAFDLGSVREEFGSWSWHRFGFHLACWVPFGEATVRARRLSIPMSLVERRTAPFVCTADGAHEHVCGEAHPVRATGGTSWSSFVCCTTTTGTGSGTGSGVVVVQGPAPAPAPVPAALRLPRATLRSLTLWACDFILGLVAIFALHCRLLGMGAVCVCVGEIRSRSGGVA